MTDAEDTELQNGLVESRNLSDASEMNLEIISIQQQVSILEICEITINNCGNN